MTSAARTILTCLALALPAPAIHARDWPEPLAALHPRLFSLAADLEFNYQAWSASPDDQFQINLVATVGLLSLGDRFDLGLRYGAYLMNGPVLEGDVPGSRLQWMMNAVQFAYGLHAAWRFDEFSLLGEYSRASQHPFRGSFSEVSYDRIMAGIGRPGGPWGPFDEAAASLRIGYVDLFDFWHSHIGKPRTEWLARLSLAAERGIGRLPVGGARVFGESTLDVFSLRAGGIDAIVCARAGLRLVDERTRVAYDIYLDLFVSNDTEQRNDRPTPVTLFGWGFRFGSAARVAR